MSKNLTPEEIREMAAAKRDPDNEFADGVVAALLDRAADEKEANQYNETVFRCLSAALKAMNEAVEITTASGPAAGMEWIADYLNETDSINEEVAARTPEDWLTRWGPA